jgi:hypothetical protein
VVEHLPSSLYLYNAIGITTSQQCISSASYTCSTREQLSGCMQRPSQWSLWRDTWSGYRTLTYVGSQRWPRSASWLPQKRSHGGRAGMIWWIKTWRLQAGISEHRWYNEEASSVRYVYVQWWNTSLSSNSKWIVHQKKLDVSICFTRECDKVYRGVAKAFVTSETR